MAPELRNIPDMGFLPLLPKKSDMKMATAMFADMPEKTMFETAHYRNPKISIHIVGSLLKCQ
jgi:hypothetical protein